MENPAHHPVCVLLGRAPEATSPASHGETEVGALSLLPAGVVHAQGGEGVQRGLALAPAEVKRLALLWSTIWLVV